MVNKIGILLLLSCHFLAFSQRIIYAGENSGGNGTETNPYSFIEAIRFANNGDIIKLVSNFVKTDYIPLVIDKELIIEGQGNTVTLRGTPISITKNVTFQNITLHNPPKDRERFNYIYANGNRLILDNVKTDFGNSHFEGPIIVAGTDENTPDAGNAEIIIRNHPETDGDIGAIIAGNSSSDKSTPTIIYLGENVKTSKVAFGGGNIFAGQQYSVTGKVTVISEALGTNIKEYIGTNSSDHILELRGDRYGFPTFTEIKNLALTNGSSRQNTKIYNPNSFNKIIINNYTIDFTDTDVNPKTTIGIKADLEGQGGTIKLKKGQKLNVNGVVSGNINLNIVCDVESCSFRAGTILVEGNQFSDASIVATFEPSQSYGLMREIVKEKARWKLIRKSPVKRLKYAFDDNSKNMTLTWQKPDATNGLTGYEIYKESSKVGEITNVDELSYVEQITANGNYEYKVYAVYGNSKSEAETIQVNITTIQDNQPILPNDLYLGRVGINTEQPEATLHIKEVDINLLPAGTAQGVIFPSFSTEERKLFENVKEGTMIFNTTSNCLEIYNGADWKCVKLKE